MLDATMSKSGMMEMKVQNNLDSLRVYWDPSDVKDLEGNVKQIGAMLSNRKKRKEKFY